MYEGELYRYYAKVVGVGKLGSSLAGEFPSYVNDYVDLRSCPVTELEFEQTIPDLFYFITSGDPADLAQATQLAQLAQTWRKICIAVVLDRNADTTELQQYAAVLHIPFEFTSLSDLKPPLFDFVRTIFQMARENFPGIAWVDARIFFSRPKFTFVTVKVAAKHSKETIEQSVKQAWEALGLTETARHSANFWLNIKCDLKANRYLLDDIEMAGEAMLHFTLGEAFLLAGATDAPGMQEQLEIQLFASYNEG